MVATPNPKVVLSRPPSPAKPKRPPLLPSDADNNNNAPPPLPRRMKSRDVSSRYLSVTDSNASVTMTSSSSSNSVSTPRRRFPSPLVTSSNLMTPLSKTTMNNSKRAVSTERRRPVTPRTGEKSVAAKMLTATPARSLSVSFQAQSVTVSEVSNSQSTGYTSGLRHCTPERRNVTPVRKLMTTKAVDQQRWPARSIVKTRSVDFTNEGMKLSGSGTVNAVRSLQKSMISETKLKPNEPDNNNNNNDRSVDKLFSDSDKSNRESVASGSTIRGATPGCLMVPARFTQETVNRLRRVQSEPVSPQLSLSRGMPSPTRARGGVGSNNNNNMGNTPSVLRFAAETRRRKVGDNAIVDAHTLRLLHNKHLQWRYANARADAAMLVQRATAEKSLYDTRVTISKIRQSVISKQIEIQKLSQNLKLYTVLKNQMPYLKVCDQVERDHIVSLSEIIVALESSTLRLPLVDGAKVNVQSLNDAIRLAADVMHALTSLIHPLVTKVEHVNTLASELANATSNERSMIDGCTDLLSILTHMEVQDCSLRAHLLQLQRVNDYRQQP
ncbi:QWRF motif-containing protein 2-like [Bidens hawaiensis]|uniref:QWRF motif-containing protein 2-like n=1 Tax=Bidens hawaiensis TaxID=980011 RepID=UPI004049DA3E